MTPRRLAYLDLLRRPLSSWIVILGIALAVAASGSLIKLYLLSQSRFTSLADEGQSVVGAKAGGIEILVGSLNLEGPAPGYLPYNLYASIKNQETVRFEDGAQSKPNLVRAVIPFLYVADYGEFRVVGTSTDFFKRPESADSPQLAQGVFSGNADQVVVGASVAQARDLKVGSSIRVETPFGQVTQGFAMQVSGILQPTGKIWDQAVFTSIETAQTHLDPADLRVRSIWGSKVINYFLIYHEPTAFAPLRSLIDQRTVGQLISIREEIEHLHRLTGTGRTFGLLLTFLILFLSGSSVAGMMVTRFDSMATQLAILRAIGYGRAEIARWLLWEGLILGAIAIVIGAAMDAASFPTVRSLSGLDLPSYVPNPWLAAVLVWAAALVVTIIAVAMPLLRLYRQDVNAALKA